MFILSKIIDNNSLEEIKEISKELNIADENPENKLDCSNVFELKYEVLEAIFSSIKNDWQNVRELDNFMINVNDDLSEVIKLFLNNKTEEDEYPVSPNFNFLLVPDLAKLATLAEKYYHNDPNTSLIKSRQFIEIACKYISAEVGIYDEIKNEKLINILNTLRNRNIIHSRIYYLFNEVRHLANYAVHSEPEYLTTINSDNQTKIDSKTALKCIKKIHKIAIWYHKTYSSTKPFKEPEYKILPTLDDITKQLQKTIEELDKQKEIIKIQQIKIEVKELELKQEKEQQNLAQEEKNINDRIQSSDLDKELTLIYEKSILKPDEIAIIIKKGVEIDRNTILISKNEIEREKLIRLNSGQILRHRYEIIDELSSGNFGTTYTAHDLDKPNKSICVVKQFTLKSSIDGTFTKASSLFNQEAQTLQQLGHYPEIPQLFAFFDENNNLFLVQEYIEGNTLRDELDIQWKEKDVVQLLKDILIPLKFIHENEIIHRDIKPENLIRRVSDNKIVIIDFGAVKQVLLEDNNQSATIIGTKNYMSPEQYMGNISYSCDIYATGIIAIEALLGKKVKDSIPKQLLEEITFISNELKEVLHKMTAFSPENRYASTQEVLIAIGQLEKKENKPFTIINSSSEQLLGNVTPEPERSNENIKIKDEKPSLPWWQRVPKTWLIGGGVGIVLLGGLFLKSLPYLTKTKLQETELTIGTLWKPEDLQGLIEHIEDNAVPANYFDFLKGEQVKVLANGDRTLSYTEAKTRMETKQWDIVFTTSPILSIFSKDQGYSHLAGMFPGSTHYQSGFFVNANSPIQSLSDIDANTIVALGGFNSASSFYAPVYDLYGKTITANTGNRGQAIIELVREGKTDVGAAAIGDSIRKDDPTLRIIHVTRDIPGSGVYASPNLSQKDRDNIQKLMLSASAEVQKNANYEGKPEPDYTEFRKIVQRVDEILVCTDFSKNPVTLACTGDIQRIEGKINGVSIEGDNSILKVSQEGKIYNVFIPANMKIDIFGSDKLTDIQGKSVVIKTNQNNDYNIKINQSNQVKVIND